LGVVEQRYALGHGHYRERDGFPDLHLADVVNDRLGDRRGQRFDVKLTRYLLEHATFRDAGRVLDARQLQRHDRVNSLIEAHAQKVDVDRRAAQRVALGFLEHDRRRFTAIYAQVEHGARGRQRQAQLTRVGVEAQRLALAAVDDARDPIRPTQAPGRARALRAAAGDVELGGRVGHRPGEPS